MTEKPITFIEQMQKAIEKFPEIERMCSKCSVHECSDCDTLKEFIKLNEEKQQSTINDLYLYQWDCKLQCWCNKFDAKLDIFEDVITVRDHQHLIDNLIDEYKFKRGIVKVLEQRLVIK